MKNNNPKIVSMTYSLEMPEEAYKKCWDYDLHKDVGILEEKLQEIPGLVEADYVFSPCKVMIKFRTGSIKEVDPKYNNKLWQKIASIINEHIKEE